MGFLEKESDKASLENQQSNLKSNNKREASNDNNNINNNININNNNININNNNNNNIYKNLEESSFSLLIPKIENYYKSLINAQKWTGKLINMKRNIKIIVWNMQHFNLEIERRAVKESYICRKLFEVKPDIVYLIDVANLDIDIGCNYKKFSDGRNVLFLALNIGEKVIIGNECNWMELREAKISFVYLSPNKVKNEQLVKLEYWLKNRYIIFGDFNFKTNQHINIIRQCSYKWFFGEETMQLGVLNCEENKYDNTIIKYRIFDAPSDHRLLAVTCYRNIIANTGVRLVTLTQIETKKMIFSLLDGKPIKAEIGYRLKKTWTSYLQGDTVKEYILNKYISNQVQVLYKKYNGLWLKNRKEPFLGKVVPEIMIGKYKKFMNHMDNKIYRTSYVINHPFGNLFKTGTWDYIFTSRTKIKEVRKMFRKAFIKSRSTAVNFELCNYKNLTESVCQWVERSFLFIRNNNNTRGKEIKVRRRKYKLKRVLRTIIRSAYDNRDSLIATAFFLKKNDRLQDISDVRMIMLVPTIIRAYEVLIYSEVQIEINKFFKNRTYQCGGLLNRSTFMAINKVKEMQEIYNANGLLCLDISKGYESINLIKFEKLVMLADISERVKWMLINWTRMVYNMNLKINNTIINRTKGIPMGLSLSPMVFILYLDEALKQIDTEYLIAYIDDISLLYFGKNVGVNSIEILKSLKKNLESFDLYLNDNKSVIITDDSMIYEEIKEVLPKVKFEPKSRLLGRNISVLNNQVLGDDNEVCEGEVNIKPLEPWNTLGMRRIIFDGALDARNRYKGYMMAFVQKKTKSYLVQRAWHYYKTAFERTSYLMIVFVLNNYAKIFIDMDEVRKWKDLDEQDLIDRKENLERQGRPNAAINEEIVIGEEEMNRRNEYIKNAMTIGIDILDKIWLRYFENDIEEVITTHGASVWKDWKDLTKRVWEVYKRILWDNWYDTYYEKVEDVYHLNRDDIFDFLNSKCIKNFGFLFDLILGHINDNESMNSFAIEIVEVVVNMYEENERNNILRWEFDKNIFKNRRFKVMNKVNRGNWDIFFFMNKLIRMVKEMEKWASMPYSKIYDEDKKMEEWKRKNVKKYKWYKKKVYRTFFVVDQFYRDKQYEKMNYELIKWNFIWQYYNNKLQFDKVYEIWQFMEIKQVEYEDGDNLFNYEINETYLKEMNIVE